jgi:predicted kinase
MMGQLWATIGPARSGKSTWATEWKYDERIIGNKCIFEDDHLRLSLHGERYKRLAEPMIFGMKYTTLRALLKSNDHVLNPETNTTERSIRNLLEIDPKCIFIIFDTPLEICIQRAIDTGQSDLIECNVINRHYQNMLNLTNSNSLESSDLYSHTYKIQQFIAEIRKEYS